MLEKLRPNLPEYHTRAMKQEFHKEVARLGVSTPPHVLRYIYQRLTLDASADQNPDLDDRVKFALQTNTYDIVLDLRHLNAGRPSDTFNEFFTTLNGMIDDWTAADERRHGIAHMSQFLSVKDLISEVKKRIPPNAAIPSEATVDFAFAPRNVATLSARHYTGKINLRHKVQSRQLRNHHSDAHYCAAYYKYMREMAVNNKEDSILLSCDDKAKVLVGEPNLPISSGVRGKRSICPAGITISALDHDVNQKGAIVPSVMLDIEVNDMKQSFYKGQVILTLKDSVFEASSPNRFVTETIKYWETIPEDKKRKCKILFLYTDGGPEHRSTFESVKISLIHLFRATGVELLVALRTAPGQSWQNPVERVMSLVNIALQNVAIERPSCREEVEKELSACNTIESIRKKEGIVKQDWLEAMNSVKETLEERMLRCSLKGVPFKLQSAATEVQISSVLDTMRAIDQSLESDKLQAKHVKGKQNYQTFKETHCRERHYCFQVCKWKYVMLLISYILHA